MIRRLDWFVFVVFLAIFLLWLEPVKGDPPSTPAPITTWTTYPTITPRTAPPVRPTPTASAQRTHRPTAPAASVSGIASWYDYVPGGAAAGPALRRALGPGWRGTVVTVCASRCVVVTLSDWCGCTTANEKLIDLDDASFRQLAPLSRGIVKVTVSW